MYVLIQLAPTVGDVLASRMSVQAQLVLVRKHHDSQKQASGTQKLTSKMRGICALFYSVKRGFQKISGARFPGRVGAGAVWMGGGDACVALVGIPHKALPPYSVGIKIGFPLLPTSQKCYNTTVPFNGKGMCSKHSS